MARKAILQVSNCLRSLSTMPRVIYWFYFPGWSDVPLKASVKAEKRRAYAERSVFEVREIDGVRPPRNFESRTGGWLSSGWQKGRGRNGDGLFQSSH